MESLTAVPRGLKKPQPADAGADLLALQSFDPGAPAGTPLFLRGFADAPLDTFDDTSVPSAAEPEAVPQPVEDNEPKPAEKPQEEADKKEEEKKDTEKKAEEEKKEEPKKDEKEDDQKDKKKDEKEPEAPKEGPAGDKAAKGGAPGGEPGSAAAEDAAGPADAAADAAGAAGGPQAGGAGAGGVDAAAAAGGPAPDAGGAKGGGGAGKAAAAPAAGSVQGVDDPHDFRDQIREASQRLPMPPVSSGGGGGPVKAAGAAAADKLQLVARKVAVEAEAAEPSPKPVPPVPEPTPDNPVPHADRVVADASGKVLEAQTPPPFGRTPRGNIPALGSHPLGAEGLRRLQHVQEEAAVPDVLKQQKDEQSRLLKQREKMLKPTPPEQKAGDPVPIRQMAPGEPLPRSPEVQAQQAQVFARLLSDPAQTAEDALKEAREGLYPDGIVQSVKPDLGAGLAVDLAASFTQQLNTLREMAGVADADVKREIEVRQAAVRDKSLAGQAEVNQCTADAGQDVAKAAQSASDAGASAAATLDKKGQTVADAAQGGGDTSTVTGQSAALISRVNVKAAAGNAAYVEAGNDRQKELEGTRSGYRDAVVAAYEQDVLQIRENSPLGTDDVALREDEIKSETWRDETLPKVDADFSRLKDDAKAKVGTLQVDLNTAVVQAREEIRAWAEQQTGVARNDADRLLEAAVDFAAQATANAKALQERQDRQTASMVGDNLVLIERLKKAAEDKVTEEDLLAQNDLTAEQRAIVHSFFHQEGAPFDPIEAVAKGILSRVVAERRGELDSKLKSELLEKATWKELEKIGNAVGPQADIGKRALDIHEALHGGLFGSNEAEKAMGALGGGLNELQQKALHLCWAETYPDNMALDADLKDQLSEGEGKRAQALLSGDKESAIAAQLYSAMKETAWGTGIGTDEKTIFKALRGLSAEEREKVIAAYRRDFKGELKEEIKGELDDWTTDDKHDVQRGEALLEGNTAKADAIAVDQALYAGGDKDDATAVYDQVRADVEEKAQREGWTAAQREAEITRRNRLMEKEYDDKYADTKVFATGPDGELVQVPHGTLRESFQKKLKGGEGAEAKLLEGYADNKREAIDAAKIRLERKADVYTSDTAVNEVLESQYDKALADARADHGSEIRRQKQLEMDLAEEAAKKAGKPWDAAERFKQQQRMENAVESALVTEAQAGAKKKMDALKEAYSGEYGESVETVVEENLGNSFLGLGGDNKKEALALLNRGYLKPYEQVKYAVKGAGTKDEMGKAAVRGKTKAELAEMEEEWKKDPDYDGTSLVEKLRGDYSGDDLNEIEISLMGKPETVDDLVAIQQKRVEQEKPAWYSPNVAGPEKKMMEGRLADLEALAKDVKDPKKRSPEEQKRLLGQLDFQAQTVTSAVEAHHQAVASITDSVANVASITVALAIGIGGAIFTGGASAAVALAIIASLASTATSIGTKLLLRGGGYGWEELMTDVGIGVIDAVVSGLTAGLGSRLLGIKQVAKVAAKEGAEEGAKAAVKASIKSKIVAGLAKLGNVGKLANKVPAIGFLEKMAAEEAAWYSKLAAKAISESIENAVQSLPSTLVGSALDKENWKGNPLKNILSATGTQLAHGVAMGLGMSAGMGALHHIGGFVKGPRLGAETHATAPEHMTPKERAAHLAEFKEMYPGKTAADFDASIAKEHAAATAKAQAEADYREKVKQQLVEGADGKAPHVGEVPITVLDPADFYRVRGLQGGDAVVVVRDGQAHLVVKKGADPAVVREHAAKIKDLVEPGTGGRTKNLKDSLPRDLRNRVPIEVNPKLEGETVRVHYDVDKATGLVSGVRIEVGPNARAVDIHNHVATARAMNKYAGLSGEVHALIRKVKERLGLKASFRPGTPEFEAHLEVKKLPKIIEERMIALQRAGADSPEGMAIALDIENLKAQLETHKATLKTGGGEARGFVAADKISVTRMKEILEGLPEETRARIQALEPEVALKVLSREHNLEALHPHEQLKYIDAVERLHGMPVADTHVHSPGLITAEDMVTWILERGHSRQSTVSFAEGVGQIREGLEGLLKTSPSFEGHPATVLHEFDKLVAMVNVLRAHADAGPAVAKLHRRLRVQAELLVQQLEAAIAMPVQRGQAGHPLTAEFFTHFVQGASPVFKEGGVGFDLLLLAVERMKERGIELELRQGLSKDVLKFLETHPEAASLGITPTQVKRLGSTETYLASVEKLLAAARQGGVPPFHGIDFSGSESGGLTGKSKGLRPNQIQAMRGVIEHDYTVLKAHLAADPQLKTQAKERMVKALAEKPGLRTQIEGMLKRAGVGKVDISDPVALAKAFDKAIKPTGIRLDAHEGLALMNRLFLETVVNADNVLGGRSRLATGEKPVVKAGAEPPATGKAGKQKAAASPELKPIDQPLVGTTIHGGEQIRGSVALKTLVADMELIAASGADRLGHGVILGMSLTTAEGTLNHLALEDLGFSYNKKKGVWEREHGKGTYERYTEKDLLRLDARREALVKKIADLGIVIEINPASNIVLSGLDPSEHPLHQMLKERPDLRFSVNTDNPGFHLTDASSELAFLYATGVLTWPQTVQGALEGYASRLGTRPIEGPGGMRRQAEKAILSGTPAGERKAVINQLKQRYPGTKIPDGVDVMTEDGFRKALRPYIRRTFQGAK